MLFHIILDSYYNERVFRRLGYKSGSDTWVNCGDDGCTWSSKLVSFQTTTHTN